ncbi:hypothetical protein OVA24_16495 [Luteolibacter sp. SL250]|uniref:virion core protein, T7 gp14 family n=1 Tax=Luteolibacter sp. SL250 TaxID=2995170 RepID=UPI0022715BF5|nr:hypothetical protein [Luteolibacter sp. SL250]WAC18831.1 hypothetical protein OVA24_16495 [Luteolibacter sp. SL250]
MGTAVLALASLATTAVSTGISFYGQKQQAKSQKYAAEYNAKVAENEARNVQLEAAESQKRMRRNARHQQADLRNQLAAGGTLTTTGTAVDLLADHAADMDLTIRDAARASSIEADSFYSQADMTRWEGKQLQRASRISSYSSLFSGVSSIAGSYHGFRYKGTLGPKRSTAGV